MKIALEKEGVLKEVKIGFSWTSLLFGAFTPLFRGDWLWFLIQFIGNLFLPIISHIIFGFTYNKIYITTLLEKGYRPVGEEGEKILRTKGYLSYK